METELPSFLNPFTSCKTDTELVIEKFHLATLEST